MATIWSLFILYKNFEGILLSNYSSLAILNTISADIEKIMGYFVIE